MHFFRARGMPPCTGAARATSSGFVKRRPKYVYPTLFAWKLEGDGCPGEPVKQGDSVVGVIERTCPHWGEKTELTTAGRGI